jgi:hypothetical protein
MTCTTKVTTEHNIHNQDITCTTSTPRPYTQYTLPGDRNLSCLASMHTQVTNLFGQYAYTSDKQVCDEYTICTTKVTTEHNIHNQDITCTTSTPCTTTILVSGTQWVRLVHHMHNVKSQMALHPVPCALLRVLGVHRTHRGYIFALFFWNIQRRVHKMYDFSTRESDDVHKFCVWGSKKNAGRCVLVPAAVHKIPAAVHKYHSTCTHSSTEYSQQYTVRTHSSTQQPICTKTRSL